MYPGPIEVVRYTAPMLYSLRAALALSCSVCNSQCIPSSCNVGWRREPNAETQSGPCGSPRHRLTSAVTSAIAITSATSHDLHTRLTQRDRHSRPDHSLASVLPTDRPTTSVAGFMTHEAVPFLCLHVPAHLFPVPVVCLLHVPVQTPCVCLLTCSRHLSHLASSLLTSHAQHVACRLPFSGGPFTEWRTAHRRLPLTAAGHTSRPARCISSCLLAWARAEHARSADACILTAVRGWQRSSALVS